MYFRRAFQRFRSERTWQKLVFLVAIVILSGCVTSEHDQTQIDRFQLAWAEKREGYAAQWLLANAEVRRQGNAAERLMTRHGAKSWPAVVQATLQLTGAINDALELAGRLELLSRFIERMESQPSASSMRRWLQAEAEQIGDDQEIIEERSAHLIARLRDDTVAPRSVFRDSEELAAEQGLVRGRARELGALYQSTTAYFASLEDGEVENLYEDDEDRRVAARALAGDITLSHATIRQRMGEELHHPRICRQRGESILCFRSTGWTETKNHLSPFARRRPWTG